MNILHVTTIGEFSKLGTFPADKSFGGGIGAVLLSVNEHARENGYYESYIVCVDQCGFVDVAEKRGFEVKVVKSFQNINR